MTSRLRAAAAVLCLAAGTAAAAETPNRVLRTEFGIGAESQTSPLVQISPQGTLIRLEGVDRLRGEHLRAGAEGFYDVPLGDGMSASIAASANGKRAPGQPDFDFASASVQPAVHASLSGVAVGLGLNRGRIDVARRHFRDTGGVQADATLADGDDHWSLVVERSRWRHRGDLVDLDTRATTVLLQRHVAIDSTWLTAADVGAVGVREGNLRGFPELSSRGALLQATLEGRWGEAGWSAGLAWHRARFDDTPFVGEPARVDRAWMADLSIQWPLTPSHAVRLDYSGVFNRSTSAIFTNRYRQFALVLQSDW